MKIWAKHKFQGLFVKLRRWPRWLKIALGALAIFALSLIFILPPFFGPTLSSDQQKWRAFSGDDSARQSLEVIRHGYRMMQAYRREERLSGGERFRPADLVSWEWFVEIRNKSWKDLETELHYYLADKEHLWVDVDYVVDKQTIPSGATVRVEHQSEMLYVDAQRVVTGVWEISWREKGSPHRSRRIDY